MSSTWRITTADSFAELRERWPELDTGTGSLFSTSQWFETLASTGFDPTERLRLLLAQDAGQGIAFCLPMAEGKSLHGLSNYYSSLFEPIGGLPAPPEDALRQIFEHAGRNTGIIDLRPLDAHGPLAPALLSALRSAGFIADTYFCFGNWVLDTDGVDFERYFAERPAALRNTVKRARGKLDRVGSWQISICSDEGPALDQAIAAFDTVYTRSWKTPEPFPRFIGALCQTAARAGWLRLGVLTLDGAPVAAQLWLVRAGTAHIYKLAYDEQYRRLSAGSVLTAEMMRRAIDVDRVGLVDYLTGDEPYKRDWMSRRRERVGIVAFRPSSAAGLLAAARHYVGKLIKQLSRKN